VLVFGIDEIQAGKVATQLQYSLIIDASLVSVEGEVGLRKLFATKIQETVDPHRRR
jgi:hypothetical protein